MYCRKSSEDNKERQMQSIESQEKELKKMVDEDGLEIVDIFREEKSAHTRGRAKFGDMLNRLEKGEANAIFTWHGNRLARNAYDGGWIVTLMDEGKIAEVKTPHRTYYNAPDDKFFLQLEFGIAKKDSDDKSKVVKRGLKQKCEKGQMPGVAPAGYLNTPELAGGSRYIKKDLERFDLLKRAWEMFASGKYSVIQIQEIMTKEWSYTTRKFRRQGGTRISIGQLYKILNDRFYCGEFEYPRGSGVIYHHDLPMVTKDIFDKVQFIFGKKVKSKPHTKNFAYTGLMKCGECGASITAEEKWKKQKNGNVHHYIYYHCTKRINRKCSQGSIQEDKLEEQIQAKIEQISVPKDFHVLAMEWLKKKNKVEFENRGNQIATQQRAYTLCVNKLKGLIDMRANQEITGEEFTQRRAELTEEKEKLEKQLNNTGQQVNKWLEIADNVFCFASAAKEKLETGEWQVRKQILGALGSDLVLKDKILSINLEKALWPLETISKELKKHPIRLEPLQNGTNKRKTDVFASASLALLRGTDSNRRPLGSVS